jgi:hypothetical protein
MAGTIRRFGKPLASAPSTRYLPTRPTWASGNSTGCRPAPENGSRTKRSSRQRFPRSSRPHLFEQVQRQLHARSPKVAAPRVTTGPILLTGLAVCASCNGGMTLRTGTSKTGAVHRYYTCSTCARKGKTVCKGRSIPICSDCFRLERLPGGACTHWKAPPCHGAHPQGTFHLINL